MIILMISHVKNRSSTKMLNFRTEKTQKQETKPTELVQCSNQESQESYLSQIDKFEMLRHFMIILEKCLIVVA